MEYPISDPRARAAEKARIKPCGLARIGLRLLHKITIRRYEPTEADRVKLSGFEYVFQGQEPNRRVITDD